MREPAAHSPFPLARRSAPPAPTELSDILAEASPSPRLAAARLGSLSPLAERVGVRGSAWERRKQGNE